MKLTWFPANEQPSMEFGKEYPYKWRQEEGMATIPSTPQTTKGPFQSGETLLTTRMQGRSLSINVTVVGTDRQAYLEARERLARALSVVPVQHGERPRLGILRFERDGLPTLELRCVPVNSPDIQAIGPNMAYADIEFYSPQPYWEATLTSSTSLTVSGTPFEWPTTGLEF